MKKYAIYLGLFVVVVAGAAAAGNFTYTVPTAGVTPGPTWASQISTALNLLKTHTHDGTANEGPQIDITTLTIAADIPINDNSVTEIESLTFNDGTSPTPSNYSIYTNSDELYFRDESGNAIKLTSGAYPNNTSSFATAAYFSIWSCAFEDDVAASSGEAVLYDDTLTHQWALRCPLPFPTASGVTTTIDAIQVYATTADANCDIDSAYTVVDNVSNSTAPVTSNVKTNEAFGVAYAAISFTTDIALSSTDVAYLYLAPGNDGGGNCDGFTFYGYYITYTAAVGETNRWNF